LNQFIYIGTSILVQVTEGCAEITDIAGHVLVWLHLRSLLYITIHNNRVRANLYKYKDRLEVVLFVLLFI